MNISFNRRRHSGRGLRLPMTTDTCVSTLMTSLINSFKIKVTVIEASNNTQLQDYSVIINWHINFIRTISSRCNDNQEKE